jgi:ABC-2 type transport system ATP-binding protein
MMRVPRVTSEINRLGGDKGSCWPQVLGMTDTIALEVTDLCRRFGRRVAVDGLSFNVRSGEVLGFLGPNGAGKTTTIRACLHLVRPTAGRVRVFGDDVWAGGTQSLARVGSLIESPALLAFLSGQENVEFLRHARGGLRSNSVRALKVVGLSDRARDRVASYSLGMKQRLGLALALIGSPELLILDEPANGLDPAGIVEMRDLLRRLAAAGLAVLVSSHVLREVEETCDRVVIINHGRLVREGAVRDLLKANDQFVVRAADPAGTLRVLRATDWGATASVRDGLVLAPSPTGHGSALTSFLSQAGYPPETVTEDRRDLEQLFLELTHEEARSR